MKQQAFVFEIGAEEIPAQYIGRMAESLQEQAEKLLAENRIGFSGLRVLYTPRRLALVADALDERQADLTEEIKGPAKSGAFTDDGQPSRALSGFLTGKGKTLADVYYKTVGAAAYVYVKHHVKGGDTADILTRKLEGLVKAVYVPNTMRWGGYAMGFIRPIRWFMAMFGKRALTFATPYAKCGAYTRGHRTLADKRLRLTDAGGYETLLKEQGFVIADPAVRREMIVSAIRAYERETGVTVKAEAGLVDEIVSIVEYPALGEGRFPSEYLAMPDPVIITPMETQQRYFPVYRDGKLTDTFLFFRNGGFDRMAEVAHGNERVLNARLRDGKFFYEDDKKTTLRQKAEKLASVVFQEKLGTLREKSERVKTAALAAAPLMGYADTEKIAEAAALLKADLVSAVVKEFDEVQGVMGGIYAREEGYPADIADAIAEQYLPGASGGRLPATPLGALMAVADKLDSVLGLIAAGFVPTGSQDPYALRRQVLGILAIQQGFSYDFSLTELVRSLTEPYRSFYQKSGLDTERFVKTVQAFVDQRLKGILEEKYPYELLSRTAVSEGNIVDSVHKLEAVKKLWEAPWFHDEYLQVHLRMKKLVKDRPAAEAFDPALFDCEDERRMYAAFSTAAKEAAGSIGSRRYACAIEQLSRTAPAVNAFFDNNLVLCENERIRLNRIRAIRDMLTLFDSLTNAVV
ncbi:MAG: glycine--tRNA ligase subunit beta [Clostridiales bacterium]|jgi:glycyl-tRNA synthetase beta chain|nr:glycine--tRNA ligase subunit beta [Clostridiales bacterium]